MSHLTPCSHRVSDLPVPAPLCRPAPPRSHRVLCAPFLCLGNVKSLISSCTSDDGLCLTETQFSQAVSIFFIGQPSKDRPFSLYSQSVARR